MSSPRVASLHSHFNSCVFTNLYPVLSNLKICSLPLWKAQKRSLTYLFNILTNSFPVNSKPRAYFYEKNIFALMLAFRSVWLCSVIIINLFDFTFHGSFNFLLEDFFPCPAIMVLLTMIMLNKGVFTYFQVP